MFAGRALIAIAGDIAGAATALAGLLLVFLGAAANSFFGYEKTAQGSVRSKYKGRAWLAFAGFCASTLAAALAMYGHYSEGACAVGAAFALLIAAFVFSLIAALLIVLDIK